MNGTEKWLWNGSAFLPDGSGAPTGANGPAGADAKCNFDLNKPTSGTYKAMIIDTLYVDPNYVPGARLACTTDHCIDSGLLENIDWVLKPDTVYTRPDGTMIMTTNASGVFDFGKGGAFTNPISTTGFNPWTGLAPGWVSDAGACNRWITASPTVNGVYGIATSTVDASIYFSWESPPDCGNVPHPLYCVEQ